MESAWIGLIGVLGGGLLTLLTTWVAQRWQTTEHREERAEQKREAKATLRRKAYARYLSATEAVVIFASTSAPLENAAQHRGQRTRALRDQGASLFADMSTAECQLRLLAGNEVLAAFDAFEVNLNDYLTRVIAADEPSDERMGHAYDTSLQHLVAAMRAEQQAS